MTADNDNKNNKERKIIQSMTSIDRAIYNLMSIFMHIIAFALFINPFLVIFGVLNLPPGEFVSGIAAFIISLTIWGLLLTTDYLFDHFFDFSMFEDGIFNISRANLFKIWCLWYGFSWSALFIIYLIITNDSRLENISAGIILLVTVSGIIIKFLKSRF